MPVDIRPPPHAARDHSRPTGWECSRLGVAIPLSIIVGIAIVCIVVAGLTSARRADEVALEREQHLFVKALVNRGEWSVRKLHAALPDLPIDARASRAELRRFAGDWHKTLMDYDILVIADNAERIVSSQIRSQDDTAVWDNRNPAGLAPLIDRLQGRTLDLPAGVLPLREKLDSAEPLSAPAAVLQRVQGRPAIVAAVALPQDGGNGAADAPLALTVMFIDEALLADIGSRLQLTSLRERADATPGPGEHLFSLTGAGGRLIARFGWVPQRPGAQVLHSVIPFICIAIAGFAFLAGLVLRYMRQTAATIAAGEGRLRHLAMHDPLCGLPNRNYFGDRLEATIAGVRGGGAPAAVFYIDLDHFKDVNDTLGHPVGDELIRAVTVRLSDAMRDDALVARLGGDEFALITPASADQCELHAIAGRLIETLCAPYTINGYTIVIGASIGIATIGGEAGPEAADIMRYADMALYRAKNEGRNRACIYDAVMDADLSQRKLIEQDLREAIVNGSLDVLFQPIVNASGERVVAVEALSRWTHPARGAISPAEFIPLAEHSGLIVDLGAQVMRRSCLAARAWPGIEVAVNVSPLQFRQHDFVGSVERILQETGFDPQRLELELTESTLLGNLESAEAAMRRLKALGVRLALDDFGTGYSSLQYLRRLPFDRLKIDRSFVLSIEKAPDAAAIVHAVVSLGRGLGMKVTAEGVETAEQHLFLRAAGVQHMQGFRFGRPGSADEIARRIASPGVYRSIEGDAAAALTS